MQSFLPEDVIRYLLKYQVKGWNIERSSNHTFKNIVVIPALAEYENIRTLLSSLIRNDPDSLKKSLILFVVNNTQSAKPDLIEDNQLTLKLFRKIINKEQTSDNFISVVINSDLNLAFIDASTEGKELPDREGGVGFARKLGMDLALTVFDYQSPGRNILICLDADCTVESNYLGSIIKSFNEQNFSAACIKFRHVMEGSQEEKLAIICYEIFLRYYVLGLKYARSPYAFHTVGSSMACDYIAYIKSEGMNRFKAAEDFYFLEKLAKNFPIRTIEDTAVYPSSRPSWRVPFGTGQRVNRFLSHKQNEYVLYNPDSFQILKSWLKVFNSPDALESEEYLREAFNIHPELKIFLDQQNFSKSWQRIIQNNKSEIQINRQKTFWFDGFKTLKLIHHLRDNGIPNIEMFNALDTIFQYYGVPTDLRTPSDMIPSLGIQTQYLELLRNLT